MISLTVDLSTATDERAQTYSFDVSTRGELVQHVDSMIRRHAFSGRARRQVNLVRIWQALQHRGRWKWSIHDTCGRALSLTFHAVKL